MSGSGAPYPEARDPGMDGGMVLPLVIRDEHGRTLAVSRTSNKGFSKTTEQRRLWVIHPETGRLVPDDADLPLVSIAEGPGFYEATVRTGLPATERNGQTLPEEGDSPGTQRAPSRPAPTPERAENTDVLTELQEVIRERARTLPEGSYTTHLLQSGGDKIRKKLGEEAIELLLAPNREHMAYEAADLLYHLLVLLVAENGDIGDVMAELRRRH